MCVKFAQLLPTCERHRALQRNSIPIGLYVSKCHFRMRCRCTKKCAFLSSKSSAFSASSLFHFSSLLYVALFTSSNGINLFSALIRAKCVCYTIIDYLSTDSNDWQPTNMNCSVANCLSHLLRRCEVWHLLEFIGTSIRNIVIESRFTIHF